MPALEDKAAQDQGTVLQKRMKKSRQAPGRFMAQAGPTGGEEARAAAGIPQEGAGSWALASAAKAELPQPQTLTELCRARLKAGGEK